MKNREYYENFLARYDHNMCSNDAPWQEDICTGHSCVGCIKRLLDWFEQDHEIITQEERGFLANVNDLYEYIGRDGEGDLWLFEKPARVNNDGRFENNGGRIYKLPDFIAEEFDGIKCKTFYIIAVL